MQQYPRLSVWLFCTTLLLALLAGCSEEQTGVTAQEQSAETASAPSPTAADPVAAPPAEPDEQPVIIPAPAPEPDPEPAAAAKPANRPAPARPRPAARPSPAAKPGIGDIAKPMGKVVKGPAEWLGDKIGGVVGKLKSTGAAASKPAPRPARPPKPAPTPAPSPPPLDRYQVTLSVDQKLKIPGPPGELRVWIGSPEFKPELPAGTTADSTQIPALGESAKVEPFAPSFEIKPAATQCIRIHPSGSEVRFQLTPRKDGTFDVGASIFLYESADCSGAPVPKTAATLQVVVEVDRGELVREKATDLWDVFWEKLLEFWGALIALMFALILFLIRGKLKQWFGFAEK